MAMRRPTKFEQKLQRLAQEATKTNDAGALALTVRMLTHVRRGEYDAARELFHRLRPIYRARLEGVPANRDEDED
jgi:hypothetical protein